MNDMEYIGPAIVIAIIFYFSCTLLDSLIRRKERIMMIDKLPQIDGKILPMNFDGNNLFQKTSSYWPMRIGLLMSGVGLGLLMAFFVELGYSPDEMGHRMADSLYGAAVVTFGGIGLIIAHLIERHEERAKAAERRAEQRDRDRQKID